MSAHLDSPSGQQFCVRYDPQNGAETYWSHVYDTREDGERDLEWWRKNGYESKLYVRYVSPWREDSPQEQNDPDRFYSSL